MEGAGPSTGKAATVWVQAGAEWLVGDVTSVDGQTAQVKTPDGRIHKLSTSSLLYTNSEGSDGIADLVKLEHLHEASIWHSLKSRYDKNVIYTYIGPILVSINPYTDLKLYTQSMVDHYRGKFISETQPHIYALADQTFRNMMNERKNQSVLISGESGAGKTEATKIMLAYLAKICSSNIVDRVAQQVLESNPVLEAFGNAKTVRNNNSSRFGKYFEVLFDAAGRIVGANIENYLLEKSRVVSQAENERSYHIFYQLCAGASAEEKAALHLGGVDDYAYLQNGSSHKIEGVDDAADFQHVKAAMTLIGFDVREQRAMFRIVSAILHLGNITFDEREDGEASAISEDGRKQLEVVCELLEVDLPTLEEGLCSRTMSGGQGDAGTRKPSSRPSLDPRAVAAKEKEKSGVFSMRIPLKPAQAAANRDALAKGLYGRMFSWLVQRVNESIRAKSYANSIGILDIYGFEVFTRNSFEQLCINYTNEKLHQQYLENLFKLEQEEYKREGINWELVKFTDNADVIELIESRAKVSILSLLDDESQFPRGADETLLHKLHENLSRQKCYVKPRRDADKSFVVTHYAGDVTYEAEGFVDKNKDTVHIDLVRAMQTSKCDIVSLLFAAGQQNFAAGTAAPVKKPGSAVSLLAATTQPTARTVSAYFRDQLASLMERLRSTEIHYVRCIKPNHDQAPHYIDTTLIMNQLRYTGILDTIRIRRQGFAIRRSHKDFILRYRVLWSRPEAPPADPKAFCLGILESAGVLPDGDWALGSTRVYIRDDKTMSALESLLEKRLAASALKVQATVRGRLTRRRFVALRSCARALQFLVRLKIARDRFRKRYRAALRLQCAWRTRRLERRFQKLREAAFIIQTAVRKWRARRRAAEIGPSGNQVEKGTTALARKLRLILGEVKKRHHIAAGTAGSALNAMVDRHVRQPMPRRQCKAQTAADIDRVRLALERALGAAEPAIEAACVDAVRREIEYLAEVTRGAGAAGLSASPFFDKAGPSSSGTEEEKENRPPPLGLGKQLFEQSATLQEEKRMLEKRVAELERLKSAAELAAKESAHRLEAFYSQVRAALRRPAPGGGEDPNPDPPTTTSSPAKASPSPSSSPSSPAAGPADPLAPFLDADEGGAPPDVASIAAAVAAAARRCRAAEAEVKRLVASVDEAGRHTAAVEARLAAAQGRAERGEAATSEFAEKLEDAARQLEAERRRGAEFQAEAQRIRKERAALEERHAKLKEELQKLVSEAQKYVSRAQHADVAEKGLADAKRELSEAAAELADLRKKLEEERGRRERADEALARASAQALDLGSLAAEWQSASAPAPSAQQQHLPGIAEASTPPRAPRRHSSASPSPARTSSGAGSAAGPVPTLSIDGRLSGEVADQPRLSPRRVSSSQGSSLQTMDPAGELQAAFSRLRALRAALEEQAREAARREAAVRVELGDALVSARAAEERWGKAKAELEERLAKAEAEVASSRKKVGLVQQALSATERDREDAKEGAARRDAELSRLRSEKGAAERRAEEAETRRADLLQVLETTKAEHAAKMTESVKEKRELQERYDAARREADTLLSDKRALSDTLEQRMGEVEKLRARVEEAARALEESQAAGRKAQDDIRSLEREREGLKSEIARATAALREQEAATRAVEEEKGASASAARALDDAKARVEARLAESEAARATAEAELESVQRELAAVKKERHGLSNQVAQLEELQAAESAAAKDARGRLAELQKEKAALENQFAVAKGERAGLERELEQLREAKKGDISKLKEAAEAENLRLVRERAELQTRLEVELAESQRQVSTLGEMKAALERDLNDVRERRRVIGDQLRDTEAAKEAAEAALAAAQARGRKLEADLAEARDKLAQADEARRALEGELERARAAGEKLAKEKAALEAAAAELERGKERAERERAAAEEEASKLQREASHTQKHLRDLEQSKTVLEGDVARLTGRCQALETERAELAERLTRADRARNEAASELDSAVDKRKELEREKRRLKEELHEAEDREEAARREAAAQQARAEQAEASGARLAEKLAAEERKCASVGAEAEDRARRLEALAQERDELRGRLGAEEEACRQALAGVARLERELARATGDYEEAEGRAREREARVAELEEQLAEEHEAVAAATSENGQLQERLREQELLAQDRGAAVEKLKAELEGAQREAAAAAGELEAARRELAGAQAELLAVQTEGVEEVERLQCENADISEELDQANLALTKLEKKHEALEKEMRRREDAWASEKETTKETIQSLMDKLQEARMETAGVRESERELERARAEIRALKDRIAVLEEANREVAFNAIG
eukprot:tig00000113_g5584.t1